MDEDELIFVINKTKKLTYVYILGRNYFRRNTWGNETEPAKKVYDLYIIPEQSKNLEETLNNLNNFINFNFMKKRKIISLSKKIKKLLSVRR